MCDLCVYLRLLFVASVAVKLIISARVDDGEKSAIALVISAKQPITDSVGAHTRIHRCQKVHRPCLSKSKNKEKKKDRKVRSIIYYQSRLSALIDVTSTAAQISVVCVRLQPLKWEPSAIINNGTHCQWAPTEFDDAISVCALFYSAACQATSRS